MDGFFACPECGNSVEVEGVAPGRQVRCGFCDRLVEVPYLPRVPAGPWRRRRFWQSRWVRLSWWAVAAVLVLAAMVSAVRIVKRQYRSAQDGTIQKLIDSSRAHEAGGRLDEALVDLDAALDLLRRSDDPSGFPLEEHRRHRADLARRDAQADRDRLARDTGGPYPLGDWLNLVARSSKDPDLADLRPGIEADFRRTVRRQGATELEAAGRDYGAGRVAEAMRTCDRIARLLPHLAPEDRPSIRRGTEDLVDRLVTSHGVTLETTRSDFVLGSFASYRAHLVPIMVKVLEVKGYLPYREDSPWRAAWQKALYHVHLEVSERREGNYLSSENRLTRIDAHLTFTSAGRVVWEAKPTARTTVPVPGLPAYLSTRIAVTRKRSDEFERVLYEDARGQIDLKFRQALGNMPACCP